MNQLISNNVTSCLITPITSLKYNCIYKPTKYIIQYTQLDSVEKEKEQKTHD